MAYSIGIRTRYDSDIGTIKSENMHLFRIFDDARFQDENLFRESIIVFNELYLDNGECMAIASNLHRIQTGSINDNEFLRTMTMLELLEYNDKEFMENMKKYFIYDAAAMSELRKTTKIFHLN